MLGTNPYSQESDSVSRVANELTARGYSDEQSRQIAQRIIELQDEYSDNSEGYWEALMTLDWDQLLAATFSTGQNVVDMLSGDGFLQDLQDVSDIVDEVRNESGGYVSLNGQYVHVEPGSISVKPKLNISQTDMYMDGEDGYSYTYMQWLNTTGIVITMTIYSKVSEFYNEDSNNNLEGETKVDTELTTGESMIHEALMLWARTFTTIDVWFGVDLPNITEHSYKITDIQQTMETQYVVKTELELTEYSQDEMEETYYKQYDINDLVSSDMSGDTSLAANIDKIPTGLKQECNCTGSE